MKKSMILHAFKEIRKGIEFRGFLPGPKSNNGPFPGFPALFAPFRLNRRIGPALRDFLVV
jgi:hypothetical protein